MTTRRWARTCVCVCVCGGLVWSDSNLRHRVCSPLTHWVLQPRSLSHSTAPQWDQMHRHTRTQADTHTHIHTNMHQPVFLHAQTHKHRQKNMQTHKYKHANIICLLEESVSLHNRSDCCRAHKIGQLWQHFWKSVNLLATKSYWAAVPFMWCRVNIQQDIISQEWDVCMLFMSIKENILINSGRARVCPGL